MFHVLVGVAPSPPPSSPPPPPPPPVPQIKPEDHDSDIQHIESAPTDTLTHSPSDLSVATLSAGHVESDVDNDFEY